MDGHLTRLLVPEEAAHQFLWLDASLEAAAQRSGASVDPSQVIGAFRSYDFAGLSAAELKPFADYALLRGGEGLWARVTGEHEITVETGFVWIRPMGMHRPSLERPHPYLVEFRELCRHLAWDSRWKAWWAQSGYLQFNFHQRHDDPEGPWEWINESIVYAMVPLDLTILSVDNASQSDVAQQARANVGVVLDRLADRLDTAPPPLPDALS